MKSILFIGPHRPNRNGSQRFRMEQYFPYLREAGFKCDYSWFINEKDDLLLYSAGNTLGKLKIFVKAIVIRLRDVMRANHYDVIFIQREAFMTASVFFEKSFSRSKAKVIFDFDDAIWLPEISASNKRFAWLKHSGKIAEIISNADLVIAGNAYLAEYAKQFNSNVEIIPTVIDTAAYLSQIKSETGNDQICIGWSGSKTTIKHFALSLPVLKTLKGLFGNRIKFKQIGDKSFKDGDLNIESDDWHYEDEVTELNKIHIGIMPLPDDEWSKGKCAFKALQYMALEIPPVVSPVGFNAEVIQNGVNGFLAGSQQDWIDCISELIMSPSLRARIGNAARRTVIEKYSVNSRIEKIISLLNSLMSSAS